MKKKSILGSEPKDPNRGTGRTKNMVMSLPETGCIVVVHERNFVNYVKTMALDLRGPVLAKSIRFVALEDVERRIRGYELPIFIDHYVTKYAFRTKRWRELDVLSYFQNVNRAKGIQK